MAVDIFFLFHYVWTFKDRCTMRIESWHYASCYCGYPHTSLKLGVYSYLCGFDFSLNLTCSTSSTLQAAKHCISTPHFEWWSLFYGTEWFRHIPRNGTIDACTQRNNQTIQTDWNWCIFLVWILPLVSKVYVTTTRMLRTRLWGTKMETIPFVVCHWTSQIQ